MGRIIGIDLGTTNSLAAVYTSSGPKLIPLPSGAKHLPSAVAFDPIDGLVIGEVARDAARDRTDSAAVISVKRHMGTDRSFVLGGQDLSPQAISAFVLKELKRTVEARIRAPVDRAVISVPAYFSEVQRRATREAGELAGLRVERLISEPTAAALAYGVEHLDTEQSILVFDLGGGTFDVSILEMFEGIFSVRECGGDSRLGGDDFDERLFQCLEVRINEHLAPRRVAFEAKQLLRLATESAKIDLSKQEKVVVRLKDVPIEDGGVESFQIEVSRDLFESKTRDLLERTGRCVMRVLGEANLTREKIGEVLLVGGSTRMPMIAGYLRELLGVEPKSLVDPMAAVALGAAVQAHMLEEASTLGDVIVTDVSPFTLGVAAMAEHRGELRPGVFVPLIQRNSTLPIRKSSEFAQIHPDQDTVVIEVYQGDDPLVENNVFLDRYYLGGIPVGTDRPEAIDITFQFDVDGILQVDAIIQSTGRRAGIRIDSSKMAAVGSHQLGTRDKVEELWQGSRHARRLRELVETLNRRIDTFDEGRQAALRSRIETARKALATGDEKAMQSIARELAAFLPGDDK